MDDGTNLEYKFQANRPNAKTMFTRATTEPCPLGILRTADYMWKQNKQQQFFGFSYTSPTPSIYTTQKLGLGITKAFTTHIRNATKISNPNHSGTATNNTLNIFNIDST